MKKALFFDIDGTLVAHDIGITTISENVINEIRKLQKEGHLCFVASGRPYAFLSQDIVDAGFDGYILCNGAHVELNKEIIFHQNLGNKQTNELINILEDIKCEYIIETDNYSYLKPEFKVLDAFFKSCAINENMVIKNFDVEEAKKLALKVEVNVSQKDSHLVENYIKDKFKYDNHGTENAFEIYSRTVSKATGIKKIIEYLGIDINDTYAFGDGLNDIEMIEAVGHGVAMGNAVDELKAVADYVTDPIGEDGLIKAIKNLVYKGE